MLMNKRRIEHIIPLLKPLHVSGPATGPFGEVHDDSRRIAPGDLFVAVKGSATDGHRFIEPALRAGARVIVAEKADSLPADATQIIVEDSARARLQLARYLYGESIDSLRITGVTGTNGKTTIATMLYQLFENLGYPAGLISTVHIKIHDRQLPASNTTPGLLDLYRLLAEMAAEGIEHVFMEVSSHALDQGRTEGIRFGGGIFTNLSRDHLDYHGDMISYRNTKKRFFDHLPAEAFALYNADDKNGPFMVQNTPARRRSYAMLRPADYKVAVLEESINGMLLEINGRQFYTPLLGRYNAYNLAAVYGAGREWDLPAEEMLVELSRLTGAPGRMERLISPDGKIAVVDYAHTPDALENVLRALRQTLMPGKRIITVVGAGGNRDRGKRPLMGKAAAIHSDWVILTSDNPRDEDPAAIIRDMHQGIPAHEQFKVLEVPDRRQAIKTAIMYAAPGDIILVAGKGHENYQIIGKEVLPFSDREVISEFFNLQHS